MIDTKRLATDAAYWDEVAPDYATGAFVFELFTGEEIVLFGEGRVSFSHSENVASFYKSKAAIPRPQSKWVDGLPGVGTRCLGRHKAFNSNFECEINGYRDGKVWFTDFSGSSEREFVYTVGQIEFSPIPTKAQRDRDELSGLICNNIKVDYTDGNFYITDEKAVDAIIAAGWTKP